MAKTKVQEFGSTENFAELLEQSFVQQSREGEVVKGRVVGMDNKVVFIDLGLKSEAQVPLKEFGPTISEINVGDMIDVFLEHIDSRKGMTVVSREKALREEAWERLEKLSEAGESVNGVIFGRVKGGFTVDLGGVVAFLPGSQVDIRPIQNISPLMGIEQPFQILKMSRVEGNIVVSRRAVLEESRKEERNKLLGEIEENQILDGIVKNITDYGAFIDLGSIDGLLHVTDISWNRINHPSEVLSIGQTIKVQVIKFNKDTKRISLGMKQLEGNPWQGIDGRYPKNSITKGIVTNITDYGAFIELESGIEGLVHVSEISWTKSNVHPRKLLNIGEEIAVKVLEIDPERHRISLGIKQTQENPWELFASKYPVGSVIEGEVKNVVEFGLFVGLDYGIDGLVHISDVCWSGNPEEEIRKFKKDEKINVKVLALEVDKERISLGLKQLAENPMAGAFDKVEKGAVVTCVVKEVTDEGIEVQVTDGLSAFIKKADLSRDRVDQRPERFAVGDRVDAKVTAIDKNSFKVTVSIKALEMDEHKKAIAEYGSTDSGASLGDILGAALVKNKEKKKSAEDSENAAEA